MRTMDIHQLEIVCEVNENFPQNLLHPSLFSPPPIYFVPDVTSVARGIEVVTEIKGPWGIVTLYFYYNLKINAIRIQMYANILTKMSKLKIHFNL